MEKLLNILFPRFCLGCSKEGSYICQDCKAILDISSHQYCLCQIEPKRDEKCFACNKRSLNKLYFPLPLKERALTRKLLHFFKNPPYYAKDMAKDLVGLVFDHLLLLEEDIPSLFKESVLIPLPQNKKELKQRGYNQNEELAKRLLLPVYNDVVFKKESSIEGAFYFKNTSLVKDKRVFLISDVYNEAEMEECAAFLKEAKEVFGISIVRG